MRFIKSQSDLAKLNPIRPAPFMGIILDPQFR